jgi:transposase
VPSRLIREEVEARITDATVEILHKGSRVASHARSLLKNSHTTINEHMPSAHRRYAEWTPARLNAASRQDRTVHDRTDRGDHESQAASRANARD